MTDKITLSPSNLTFLWHSCKRCFYNHHVFKNRRPMTMPLVGKMASLSEDWFIEKETNEIDPDLSPGKIVSSQKSLKAEIESNENLSRKYTISGKIDLLIEFEDGTFGIFDCKNTSGDSDKSWMYHTQLAAYKYCFEKMELGEVSQIGLIYQIIEGFYKSDDGNSNFTTEQKFVNVTPKMDQFEKLLSSVIQCLESEITPNSSPNCSFCKFAEKYNENLNLYSEDF